MAKAIDIEPELHASVKTAVRATAAVFDDEVTILIKAALADLARVGVAEECFSCSSDFYPLVVQAVIVYCKAHFGQDNPNAEMDFWRESYLMHVDALLNSGANVHSVEQDDEVE